MFCRLQEVAAKEAAAREEEEQRQKEELEEFQKKLRGRKRKPRKHREQEVELSAFDKYKSHVIGAIVTVIAAIVLYWLFVMD